MRHLATVVVLTGCSFTPGALGERAPDAATSDVARAIDSAVIVSPTCTDSIHNGDESDVDCGGSCSPCVAGKLCGTSADCVDVCDGTSCRIAYSCAELHQAHSSLGDAAYTLDPDGASNTAAVTTYCDMTTDGGGWTLIGKVDGRYDMYAAWLVTNANTANMTTPTIGTGAYACIDAVALAVDHATDVRLSNSARTRWVKWPLPASRAIGTFWRHTVGQTTIDAAPQPAVTATAWDGTTSTCYHNEFGVMNWDAHGGAYPATGRNTTGNTTGNDLCMAIGTMTSTGVTVDGFTSNGNQFDAPVDETTWPNTAYNVTPHVAVWLR